MGHDISIIIVALMVVVSHFSLSRRKRIIIEQKITPVSYDMKRLEGRFNKVLIASKVSEKTANRAFALASSANVGIGVLSKTLTSRPKIVGKTQIVKDQAAKAALGDIFGGEESEWLKPLLTDDEIELLEEANRQANKSRQNGIV